MKLYIL